GQAHAHHDAWNLQVLVELGDDGNRATRAYVHRVLPEDFVHGFDRDAGELVVGVHHTGRAFAVHFDVDRNAFRRELLHAVGVLLEDVVGVLVGHQAHGNLRRRAR